jgi:hypothetical protein
VSAIILSCQKPVNGLVFARIDVRLLTALDRLLLRLERIVSNLLRFVRVRARSVGRSVRLRWFVERKGRDEFERRGKKPVQ